MAELAACHLACHATLTLPHTGIARPRPSVRPATRLCSPRATTPS
jgi:hypothetical protein